MTTKQLQEQNKTIYEQLTDLAREYLDYSERVFGWQTTSIVENKENQTYYLQLGYTGTIGELYFADGSKHKRALFGRHHDVSIHLFSPATIQFAIHKDLDETLAEYTEILKQIKEYHEKDFEFTKKEAKIALKHNLEKRLLELESESEI